jgi:hypothetical protein
MPLYAHICRGCRNHITTTTRETGHACSCGSTYRRDFSFRYGKPTFVPHHNWAVGRYVTSDRDFRDALKARSDEQSQLTGIDHDYQPRYPGDRPAPTSDMDGVEKRMKVMHDAAS